jgi:hypothetical protein
MLDRLEAAYHLSAVEIHLGEASENERENPDVVVSTGHSVASPYATVL